MFRTVSNIILVSTFFHILNYWITMAIGTSFYECPSPKQVLDIPHGLWEPLSYFCTLLVLLFFNRLSTPPLFCTNNGEFSFFKCLQYLDLSNRIEAVLYSHDRYKTKLVPSHSHLLPQLTLTTMITSNFNLTLSLACWW